MIGRVSIIVPIYNCEKWLPICLDSLTGQTYKELEIILVDDGSTDRSLDICKVYSEKDGRICLVSKKNGGVSSARNEGLCYATGEWVTFVDADDWIEIDMIERVCSEVTEDRDFYIWNFTWIDSKKRKELPQYIQRISMKEMYCAIISGRKGSGYRLNSMIRAGWAKLYRTEILKKNNILFDETLYIGEDAVFILEYLRCLSGVERIKVVNYYGYHYRILDTSAVRRYKCDLLEQSQRQLSRILQLLNEEFFNYDRIIQTSLTMFCWSIFNNLILNVFRQKQTDWQTVRWDEAKCWLEQNRECMKFWKVEFWKMPNLVKLEWACIMFFDTELVCRIAVYYFEKKI